MHERAAGLAPRVDTAVQMRRVRQPGLPRGPDGHGGALAEGAIEHDLLAARAGQLVENAAGTDVHDEIRIGRVDRVGDGAHLVALAAFPQVDERQVGIVERLHHVGRRARPALARDLLLREALAHVGGHGDVHHLRVRQVELAHEVDVLVDGLHLQAWVEALLLADGRDRLALVVVGRVDQRLLGQLEKLVEQRVVLRPCAAVLEIRAARAADEQRVAGEHAILHQEAVAVVGVAGRIEHVESEALDADRVALGNAHGHDIDAGLLAHHRDAVGMIAQRAEGSDVIGVDVGVDGLDELQVEFAHELEIAVDLLEHRIDDQRLAALAAGEKVAVGARGGIEKLTEEHGGLLLGRDAILPRRMNRVRISASCPLRDCNIARRPGFGGEGAVRPAPPPRCYFGCGTMRM